MASDGYRLSPLREVRARTEAVRRGDLAAAADDARATEAELAQRGARVATARASLTAARAGRDALLAAGATTIAIVHAERYIVRRRHELDAELAAEHRARAALDERTDAVDAARGSLRQARAEREVIERHFATWREARRKLEDRRDD